MYAEQGLSLPDELSARIREAIGDVNAAGCHRTAPHRFNKKTSASERNAFTKDVVEEVAWLNSREGRARAAEKGHHLQSVLYDLVSIAVSRAMDEGMSPLQVLYWGTNFAMAERGYPDDLKLVTDFVATILAEGERQHRAAMISVLYPKPVSQKVGKRIEEWLSTIEGEYWLSGGSKPVSVLFSEEGDAAVFRRLLDDLKITEVDHG
jgi:hypothetical protein